MTDVGLALGFQPGNTRQPTMMPSGPQASPTYGRPLIGIVGGMGPLASAELLNTVYRVEPQFPEQLAPRILLWSDPAIADRTAAIEKDDLGALRSALEYSITQLLNAGVSTVVLACMTAHKALELLPEELVSPCVSLVDVVFDELSTRSESHLLLCTRGTRISGLFTEDLRWASIADRIVFPDDADQDRLHQVIYELKLNGDRRRATDFVRRLLARYGLSTFVAACTELHLVTRAIAECGPAAALPSIDPLDIVADRIRDGSLRPRPGR